VTQGQQDPADKPALVDEWAAWARKAWQGLLVAVGLREPPAPADPDQPGPPGLLERPEWLDQPAPPAPPEPAVRPAHLDHPVPEDQPAPKEPPAPAV
jgi:hypothetical protein